MSVNIKITTINQTDQEKIIHTFLDDNCLYPSATTRFDSYREKISSALPQSVVNEIRSIKSEPNHIGAIRVDGIPIPDDLTGTPTEKNPRPSTDDNNFTSKVLIGLGEQLGCVFSYYDERNGGFVQNIYPVKKRCDEMSSEGSFTVLPLHTEDLHFYPFIPRFVFFLCLREEPNNSVSTNILITKHLVDYLSEECLNTLSQPLFYTTPPPIFRVKTEHTGLMPILMQHDETAASFLVELVDTKSVSKQGQAALDELKKACNESNLMESVYLKKGQLLILDNHKIIHGRGVFSSEFSNNSRWCQRILVHDKAVQSWPIDTIDERRVLSKFSNAVLPSALAPKQMA